MAQEPVAFAIDVDAEFAELLAGVRVGDERAAAALVAQFEEIVRRRARRLLGPALRRHLDSIDIAQSVNSTLLIGLRRAAFALSTPEELTRLALTLVRRKVARHWRRRRLESVRRPTRREFGEAGVSQALSAAVDSSHEVLLHESVCCFLNRLEGLDRRLIELRLEGHTTAEAARRLGVSPAVLRSRLSRLRKRWWETGAAKAV